VINVLCSKVRTGKRHKCFRLKWDFNAVYMLQRIKYIRLNLTVPIWGQRYLRWTPPNIYRFASFYSVFCFSLQRSVFRLNEGFCAI